MKRVTTVAVAALIVLAMAPMGTAGTDTLTDSSTPTEITECTTIDDPGHYVLAENLTMTAEVSPCILINASDVVLDGDGHSIEAESRSYDSEIAISNYKDDTYLRGDLDQVYSNITVKSVHFRNVDRGVSFKNVNESTVRDSTIKVNNTRWGIKYKQSSNVRITNNTINDGSNGIGVDNSDNVVITNNIIHETRISGIASSSSNVTIAQNTITATGMAISTIGRNITVQDNLIRNNDYGLDVRTDGAVRIESNTITENKYVKFENAEFHRNTIQGTEDWISAGESNATNNYWGAANGPSSTESPEAPFEDPVTGTLADGDGDSLRELQKDVCPPPEGIASAHFDPWLNQSVTNASEDGAS